MYSYTISIFGTKKIRRPILNALSTADNYWYDYYTIYRNQIAA